MARILVADDEAPMRALIGSGLRLDGHTVVSVSSGPDAIAALHAQPFDLFVFDLFHGESHGYDHLASIRADPTIAHIPIVVLSGEGDPIDILLEAELGILDHVQKPFGFRELEESVTKILEASPAEIKVLLDIRDEAVQAYRDSISLIDEVRRAKDRPKARSKR